MKGRLTDNFTKMLTAEYFPKDFYIDQQHTTVGIFSEINSSQAVRDKYNRTYYSFDYNLTINDDNCSRTKMEIYYPMDNFNCNGIPHPVSQDSILIFGTKNASGHAFALCPDCVFKLSIILLKYYKFNQLYKYDTAKDLIRLENAKKDKKCYLCFDEKPQKFYRVTFYKRNFVLCEQCLNDFIELILGSPTTEALFPHLASEYEKANKKRTNENR
jgi:hypothetical protein